MVQSMGEEARTIVVFKAFDGFVNIEESIKMLSPSVQDLLCVLDDIHVILI